MFKKFKRNASKSSDTTLLKPSPADDSGQTSGNAKSRPTLWKSVLVGGVPGILIGAMGRDSFGKDLGQMVASVVDDSVEVAPGEIEGEGIAGTATVAPLTTSVHQAFSVSDEMSFSEAFAAARAEVGPGGAFVWHGQVYGTYRIDDPEWKEMTAEDRAEHSHHILSQVHPTPYIPTEDEPEIIEAPADLIPEETAVGVVEDDFDEEGDVHILGVEPPESGEVEVKVAYGEMDGADALFADTDGDGEVDLVLIDLDGDGVPDLDEAFDATGSGIRIDDLTNPSAPISEPEETDTPNIAPEPDSGDFLSV